MTADKHKFLGMENTPKPLEASDGKIMQIIHLFLFIDTGQIILFEGDCRKWGPISGTIEGNEKSVETARREAKEEIGVDLDYIFSTGYSFLGTSPKGKQIHGTTCCGLLPEHVSHADFTFNSEISASVIASPDEASSILRKRGFAEAASGFEYLREKRLIERVKSSREGAKGKGVKKMDELCLNYGVDDDPYHGVEDDPYHGVEDDPYHGA